MPIFMPPLRERLDDLEALSLHFIKKFSEQHGRLIQGISTETIEAMKKYRWPGNIRELENVIERCFIVENSQTISVQSLPEHIKGAGLQEGKVENRLETGVSYRGPLDFDAFKEEMEKEFIVSALKANKGKINQTVAQANIPKNTLLRKIRKYGITVKDYSSE
jgi:DNA-binding NtrC family response regulator